MIKHIAIVILFLLGTNILFPQETNMQNELLERANENLESLNTNPENAFQQAKEIEKEAKIIDAREAELKAINVKCGYYKIKGDFEKLITTSKYLAQKAKAYQIPIYRVIAKRYLFEAYSFNNLPDKAFQELEEGMKIINQLDSKDPSITVKGDLFIMYSNYYTLKGDYKNQLKYLRLAGQEFEKIQDRIKKGMFLYINYSNLSGNYMNMNQPDSARYYAERSQALDAIYGRNDIRFMNLWVLGEAEMKDGDYIEALRYFRKAEKLEGYKNHLNINYLYNDIIQVYEKLKLKDSIELYQDKKKSLKLVISENQNKSLHKLLKEKNDDKSNISLYVLLAFLIGLAVFTVGVVRKNRILIKQEKVSQQYLEQISDNKNSDLSELLEMFKNNDLAFMVRFDETFPDFTQNLLALNPKIVQSEIEFCAFLKLKIPTKDIARYRNIAHRTVQNKKYLIRKKLNIPKGVDIYHWFDKI